MAIPDQALKKSEGSPRRREPPAEGNLSAHADDLNSDGRGGHSHDVLSADVRRIGEKPATADATVDRGRDELVGMETFVTYLDEHTDRAEPVPTLLRPSDVAVRLRV